MVPYLHLRILKFPLIQLTDCLSNTPTWSDDGNEAVHTVENSTQGHI